MIYARQFCPPNKASKAVGRIKRAVQSGADLPFESALAVERELQQLLFQSDGRQGRHRRLRREAGARSSRPSRPVRTDLFIDKSGRPAASGKRFASIEPRHRGAARRGRGGGAADIDRAVGAARASFESAGVGGDDRAEARRAPLQGRRAPGGAAPRFGRARDAGQRQAALRVEDRHAAAVETPALLRGLGRQARRRHLPGRTATSSRTRCASRSASSARSSRGTSRSSWPAGSSRRRWPPATPWS